MRLLVLLAVAVTTLSACGRQPASLLSPTAAALALPASFAGAWRVTFRNDECISRHCFGMLGRESQVDLRLTQMGDRVSGVVSGTGGCTDVTGTVGPDGRLTLAGRSTPGSYSAAGLVVDRLELQPDAVHGLRGYVRLLSEYDGETSAYNGGSGGPITFGRNAPLNSTFAGTWKGYYDTVACSPGPSCLTERKGEFELVLEQHTSGLEGRVTVRLNSSAGVSGTAHGDLAQLTGDGSAFAVRNFHVQHDAVGRLSGTLVLHSQGLSMELALVRVGRIIDEL